MKGIPVHLKHQRELAAFRPLFPLNELRRPRQPAPVQQNVKARYGSAGRYNLSLARAQDNLAPFSTLLVDFQRDFRRAQQQRMGAQSAEGIRLNRHEANSAGTEFRGSPVRRQS